MKEVGDEYQALLESHVTSSRPIVPFFSSVTGKAIVGSKELGPAYWRSNLESPVLFDSAAKGLLGAVSQDQIFLGIGLYSALSGPLRQIFKAVDIQTLPIYVPTFVRAKNGTESLLSTLGQLYLQAIPINFEALASTRVVLTDLPIYRVPSSWIHYYASRSDSTDHRHKRFHSEVSGNQDSLSIAGYKDSRVDDKPSSG